MKNYIFRILLLLLLFHSCKKDEIKYTLDDFILAGQKNAEATEYINLNPEINFTIIPKFETTADTIINLDLNNDGVIDYSLKRTVAPYMMLGSDYELASIIPQMDNEICIDQSTTWVDTLSYLDSINTNNFWTNKEAIIYSHLWEYETGSEYEGFWHKVRTPDKKFIGIKMYANNNTYYGWIGMYNDSTFKSFDFFLTDYAITNEYLK